MFSNNNNTYIRLFLLLGPLSYYNFSVALLLDGGVFIAEIPEVETADLELFTTQFNVCTVKEIFVPTDTCPQDAFNIVDKKHNYSELSSVEEVETEDLVNNKVGQMKNEFKYDTNLTTDQLELNTVTEYQDVVTNVSNIELKPERVEDKKEIDEAINNSQKERKPYIVKATPKEVNPGIIKETATEVENMKSLKVNSTNNDSKASDDGSKNKSSNTFEELDNSVGEELLDKPIVEPEEEEHEEVIAPFSRWAEKKLEEEALLKDFTRNEIEPEVESRGVLSHQNLFPSHVKTNGIKLTKNFASPDCSAKIVGANPESQGAGNVITASRDDYYLNQCSDQAWFAVEFCESIKALKVQIANFELYSSSPNAFRVSIGNVYPGREKDWIEFGTFSYQDERNIQSFKNEAGVVGKFAKVEILSHHGNEHYCPVSMFKVFGISEIDLITDDDPSEGNDDDTADDVVNDDEKEHFIVETIKKAVHKVVNVFRPQNESLVETLNTSSLHGASLRFRLRPEVGFKQNQDVVNRYHMIYYLLATQYNSVKHYTKLLRLDTLLPLICGQFNVEIEVKSIPPLTPNTTMCSVPLQPWQFLKFVRLVHGEDFLVALCNVVSMELGQSMLVKGGKSMESNNITEVSNDKDHERNTTVAIEKEVEQVVENLQSGSNRILDKETENKMKESPSLNNEKKEPNTGKQIDHVPAPDPKLDSKSEPNLNTGPTNQTESGHPQVTKSGSVPSTAKQASAASVVNQASQAGQTTWQKLSNRIKALERNLTLSTGFLEELSLKYIKQIEELNTAAKTASEAISGLVKREELTRQRDKMLTEQIVELSSNMEFLEEKICDLQDEVLARHGFLLLLEVVVIGLVFLLCRPGGRNIEIKQQDAANDGKISVDTAKEERAKINHQELRRSSIEVGGLPNGHLVSMLSEPGSIGLSRKQRKRKRRKESKLETRNVLEELESDESKELGSVYETFHGAQRRSAQVEQRKRSKSWSQQVKVQAPNSQVNGIKSRLMMTNGHNLNSSRFAVDQVNENEVISGGEVGRSWDGIVQQTKKHVKSPSRPVLPNRGSDRTSAAISPPGGHRSRKSSVISVSSQNHKLSTNGHGVPGRRAVKVSNIYTMLDQSVHDTSTGDTEHETDEFVSRHKPGYVPRRQKDERSKSSSPNRQANLRMRRQRDAIRKFHPDQAEWLNKKRYN